MTDTAHLTSLTLLAHRRSGSLLLIIKPAGRDSTVEVLNPNGAQGEISQAALLADYAPTTPAATPALTLSARARNVLWLTAAHVADVCPYGLEPTQASTLAGIASLSLSQLTHTLNTLMTKGLVQPWSVAGGDVRYVPSIKGMLALGGAAPTPQQMRRARG